MEKKYIIIFLVFISFISLSQVTFKGPKLIIKHGDITLYLDSDTNTFVSKHELKYPNFKRLDSDRDNRWFQDTYKGIYNKEYYAHTGYDLGHLTPAHITSYNDTLNHESFSLFNQAPQMASFNRGKWVRLEISVEDSIAKYQSDVTIITGVIYENLKKKYLGKSKIKIPYSFYKIFYIQKNKLTYAWIGSNINGEVVPTDIKTLNNLLKSNKNDLLFIKK